MRRRSGFTLLELLTVIAIIAILAGIAFPVFARAKDSSYRSSDVSNMNQIRTALQLYRTDQGGYPPSILGYATSYMGGTPSIGDVIPADKLAGALYPKRLESLETFRPAYNRTSGASFNEEFSAAVWPNALPAPSGGDPLAYQRYGPADQVMKQVLDAGGCSIAPAFYYKLSGYDAANVKVGVNNRFELRYTLFWTGYGNPNDPCTQQRGSMQDDERQLGYTDPPETTVITWNSYFREYDGSGLPVRQKRDIALFLGGSARPVDSRDMAEQSWQIRP
jgi:prepilin-type N-terminal cleavage/methylation domain-containing protein